MERPWEILNGHFGMNERRKPQLARGKQPFTPMSRKDGKQVETPYEPLRLNDLATPKVNKSGQNSAHNSIRHEEEFENTGDDLAELKALLLNAVRVIERMENQKERKVKTKTTGTQTSGSSSQQKPPPRKKFDATEVAFSDSDSSDEVSPVRRKGDDKKKPPLPSKKVVREPATEVHVSDDRKKSASRGLSSSSGRKSEEADLEKRMRDMSLLLKRLENQLDTLDVPQ